MLYWNAFADLEAYRSDNGMGGMSAIPLSDVVLYGRMHGFTDLRRFARIIAAMDVAKRNAAAAESQAKSKTKNKEG